LEISKPRSTNIKQNYSISSSQGNYILCNTTKGTYDISGFETITLKNSGGTSIGTAKVNGYTLVSGTPGTTGAVYKIFLFDVNMNSGQVSHFQTFFNLKKNQ
jgi:urocanate hydratase